jgi:hypothetical protein
LGQEAADRGSADFKLAGDFGFAVALLVQLSGFDGLLNYRWRATEAFAVEPRMSQTGPHTLAQDFAFELGKHSEQSGRGSTRRCGQIERFGQRYESHVEMLKFLERRYQVRYGPAPAIQTPHQDHIDFTPARGSDQS